MFYVIFTVTKKKKLRKVTKKIKRKILKHTSTKKILQRKTVRGKGIKELKNPVRKQ